ncbi:jg5893 [Pararge aegeria aegeria]|uniref:Jg5893 protein n=1 Tax=Pararge aegeria aegeria TaxID=348720 RepID=A0A8S4REI5_9NEOP|nr:jg5893 [Pararge aegeria aegeria]
MFVYMKWQVAGGMGIPFAAAVFCMLPLFTSSNGDIRHHGTSRARGWRGNANAPADVTANNSVSNVTAQLGGTAYLHCLVGHLSERGQVSWIRKRDWHILSSGKFTYTNDERFQVLHGEGSEDWTLQIKFVQKRDNGTYECQVGTPNFKNDLQADSVSQLTLNSASHDKKLPPHNLLFAF